MIVPLVRYKSCKRCGTMLCNPEIYNENWYLWYDTVIMSWQYFWFHVEYCGRFCLAKDFEHTHFVSNQDALTYLGILLGPSMTRNTK